MINIIDACKKLARIELSDGSIVKVFPNLAYNGIPIVEYNIADGINGIAIDKEGNEHRISDCCCFSLDGKRINLDEVKGIGGVYTRLSFFKPRYLDEYLRSAFKKLLSVACARRTA